MRLKQKVWETTDTLPQQVEELLIEEFGDTSSEDGEKIWLEEKSYGLYQRLIQFDDEEGIVTEEIHAANWLRYIFPPFIVLVVYSLLYLLLVDSTLSGEFSSGTSIQPFLLLITLLAYGVVAAVWSGPSFSLEAGEFAVTRSTSANPYHRLLVLTGYLLVGVGLISFFISSVWPKLGVLGFGILAGAAYYWRPDLFSSPFGSTPLAMSMIPALGTVWVLFPVAAVWMLSYVLGTNADSYTEAETTLLIPGIWLFVAVLAVFLVMVMFRMIRVCETVAQRVTEVRPAWYDSGVMRYSMLLVYLLLNSVAVFAALLCLDLIYWGFTDSSVLPGSLVSPFQVMYGSYGVLEAAFRGLPLLSPRPYATATYVLLFSPVLFFLGMWIYSVVRHTVSRVQLVSELYSGDPVASEVVPDSVLVAVSDRGAAPNAHAGSVFFGRQDFIVVNKALTDSLDGDELDAVLAHEVFHLENQDWMANLLASIIGL